MYTKNKQLLSENGWDRSVRTASRLDFNHKISQFYRRVAEREHGFPKPTAHIPRLICSLNVSELMYLNRPHPFTLLDETVAAFFLTLGSAFLPGPFSRLVIGKGLKQKKIFNITYQETRMRGSDPGLEILYWISPNRVAWLVEQGRRARLKKGDKRLPWNLETFPETPPSIAICKESVAGWNRSTRSRARRIP